eukprot:3815791-Rhodomonas_salina.1
MRAPHKPEPTTRDRMAWRRIAGSTHTSESVRSAQTSHRTSAFMASASRRISLVSALRFSSPSAAFSFSTSPPHTPRQHPPTRGRRPVGREGGGEGGGEGRGQRAESRERRE